MLVKLLYIKDNVSVSGGLEKWGVGGTFPPSSHARPPWELGGRAWRRGGEPPRRKWAGGGNKLKLNIKRVHPEWYRGGPLRGTLTLTPIRASLLIEGGKSETLIGVWGFFFFHISSSRYHRVWWGTLRSSSRLLGDSDGGLETERLGVFFFFPLLSLLLLALASSALCSPLSLIPPPTGFFIRQEFT